MIMINLMNPKYYFPIRGEYKDQVLNAEIGELSGIPKENIIIDCLALTASAQQAEVFETLRTIEKVKKNKKV